MNEEESSNDFMKLFEKASLLQERGETSGVANRKVFPKGSVT